MQQILLPILPQRPSECSRCWRAVSRETNLVKVRLDASWCTAVCDQSRQSEGFRQSSQVCLLPWSAQVRAGVSFSVPSGGCRGFWKRRQVCLVPYQLDRGPPRCSQAAPTESLLLFNGLAVIGWFSPGVDISELQGIGLLLSSSSPFLLFFPLNLMLQVQLHKTHFCESAAPSDLLSLVSVSFFQLRWN